jgi:hypothetical protein
MPPVSLKETWTRNLGTDGQEAWGRTGRTPVFLSDHNLPASCYQAHKAAIWRFFWALAVITELYSSKCDDDVFPPEHFEHLRIDGKPRGRGEPGFPKGPVQLCPTFLVSEDQCLVVDIGRVVRVVGEQLHQHLSIAAASIVRESSGNTEGQNFPRSSIWSAGIVAHRHPCSSRPIEDLPCPGGGIAGWALIVHLKLQGLQRAWCRPRGQLEYLRPGGLSSSSSYIVIAALFGRRILAACRKAQPGLHQRKAQPPFPSSYPDRTSATFAAHHLERWSVRPGGRVLSSWYQ